MKKNIKLGLLSLEISKDQKEAEYFYDILFNECEKYLKDESFDIILLPERSATKPSECQELNGEIVSKFKKIAKEQKAFVIAPVVEDSSNKSYNTQVVISPTGELIHSYRKVHLAPGEDVSTVPGQEFSTFELPWFRTGIMICYDNQFPESSRILALQGAEVIFWPSFGDLKKPHRNIARCLDNNVYLLGAGVIDYACNLPATDFETSQGIDPSGKTLPSKEESASLFKTIELPLNSETGKLKKELSDNIYLNVRQPNTYGPLVG